MYLRLINIYLFTFEEPVEIWISNHAKLISFLSDGNYNLNVLTDVSYRKDNILNCSMIINVSVTLCLKFVKQYWKCLQIECCEEFEQRGINEYEAGTN